jgi:GTP-binding protein
MSDHWENVTDNVEALLDMVIENVPAPKVSEGTPQMLIINLTFLHLQVVSLLVVLKEVF